MVKNAVDVMGREEESIFEKYTKMVKDNIDYDVLISRHYLEKSMIDGMVNLIVETIISENDYIIISSTKFPKETVKSRFSKLDISHIEYVLECMNHNTTNIKTLRNTCWQHFIMHQQQLTVIIRQECNMTCRNLQIRKWDTGSQCLKYRVWLKESKFNHIRI